jgi:hypothetical protein
MQKFIYALIASGCALAPLSGFGHARFKLGGTTPPRDNSTGLKSGPCGGLARTATPTILTAGQPLTLQIDEVIDHPGYYRVAFSMSGDQFPAAMPVPTAATPVSSTLWVPYIQDVANVHAYTATVTVPNTPCTQCSLQMIQYMTENDPPSMYYSCADIEIRAAAAPNPQPSQTTPAPAPSSNCK